MSGLLVTGATGFVGLPVVTTLARRGEEVHALHTRSHPRVPGVIWHRRDLTEADALDDLMLEVKPENLIHLAWYADRDSIMSSPANVQWVERSLRLVRSFVGHGGRRMVVLGSCAEYDWSDRAGPMSELDAKLAPATMYGVAKDALRRVLTSYARQEGFELAWGRPFFLYGPRETPERLVPSIVRSLLTNSPIATSSGRQIRDYMHVEDLACAIVALLDSALVGEVNLASGVGVSLNELVNMIVDLTGSHDLVHWGELPDRPWESPSLVADIARLRDEVGFCPRWGLVDGLDATVRWWEGHSGITRGSVRECLPAGSVK